MYHDEEPKKSFVALSPYSFKSRLGVQQRGHRFEVGSLGCALYLNLIVPLAGVGMCQGQLPAAPTFSDALEHPTYQPYPMVIR